MTTRRRSGGYSLPEVLVATAALGVVMAGTLGLLQSMLRAHRWGAARVEAQQSARVALERIVKEVRDAGYDPRAAGIEPIVAAEPARVVFQRDLDGDGLVDPTSERVAFLLRPGESVLRRDAGAGAQPIVTDVRRFTLTYFDAAGLPTIDPGAVASIQVEIEVGPADPPVSMRTRVSLRNRRG